MSKLLIILILLTRLIAQENKQDTNIHIWNKMEEPYIGNYYQDNKKIYHTDNIANAIGTLLIQGLYHKNELLKNKKLQTNFKYLKDFDEHVH